MQAVPIMQQYILNIFVAHIDIENMTKTPDYLFQNIYLLYNSIIYIYQTNMC